MKKTLNINYSAWCYPAGSVWSKFRHGKENRISWVEFSRLRERIFVFIYFLTFFKLCKSVKKKNLIFYDGLGAVGLLPCSGAERQIFTLSARGFDLATFLLLVQRSNH
jgi:hypothetical protein